MDEGKFVGHDVSDSVRKSLIFQPGSESSTFMCFKVYTVLDKYRRLCNLTFQGSCRFMVKDLDSISETY